MAIARRIAYNVVFNSILKMISTVVLSLLSIRLVTEYLGKDGFGEYATILAFFAFFGAVADLGLSTTTTREISREGADEQDILGNVFALRIVASIGFLVLIPIILFFFKYPIRLEVGIVLAGIAFLFSSMSLLLNGIFQKRILMDRVAMVEFLGKVLQVGLIFLVVRFNLGFLAIVSVLVLVMAFNATTVFFLSRRLVSFTLRFRRSYWKSFLKQSFPLGATAIIVFAYFKFDTILLSIFRPSGEVGVYGVAYKVIENLIFFPAMVAGLILPLISRYIFSNRKKFEEIADETLKVFFALVTPIVVGTFFFAPAIIHIVSGGQFTESVPVLRILVFALGAIFFGQYFNMLLIAGSEQKKLMQALSVAAVFNVSLNLFLIPRYSYFGAAISSVATEILVVLLTATIAFRVLKFRPRLRYLWKVVVSAGCMAGGALLFPGHFFLGGFASVGAYLFALWLTRAVTTAEIKELFSGRRNDFATELEELEETVP